jgi:hypothetical protein
MVATVKGAFLKASINRMKVRRKRSYVPVRRTKVPAKHRRAREQVSWTEDSARGEAYKDPSVAMVSHPELARLGLVSPPRITLGMNAFVSAIQPHHHSQRTPAKKLVPT